MAEVLFEIPLYRLGDSNNWMTIPVMAIDSESFRVFGGREDLVLRDEDLKPNKEGKFRINIESLDLKFFYPNVDLPKEFEMPVEVLEERRKKRMLKNLAKNAIAIIPYQSASMYFYIENEKLRILHKGNETTAEAIEIIHNRKAVNVEALKLGHPYLELPLNVATAFEKVLQEKELRTLALVPVGKSLLNGKKYFKLNMDVTAAMWNQVKTDFEDWGEIEGKVTCSPSKVSEILKIPISGL